MADQNAINQALFAAIQQLTQQLNQQNNPAPPQPITEDPHRSNNPYNLRDRSGDSAYREAKQPIAFKWDGTVSQKSAFINATRVKADKCNWNANGATGICEVNGKNIFTHYQDITEQEITDAKNARNNARAVQNATAMFDSVSAGITGNLHSQLFDNVNRMPDCTDGISLFLRALNQSGGATPEAALNAARRLFNYSPAKLKFDIKKINTELRGLFIEARSQGMDTDEIQYNMTIHAYEQIKQPMQWVTFVDIVKAKTHNGVQIDTPRLMALAEAKATSLQETGFWNPTTRTYDESLQHAVVALQSNLKNGKPPKNDPNKDKDDETPPKPDNKYAPFIKDDKAADGTPYKVGDTKDWNGTAYHYCDFPNHRHSVHWHKFAASDCNSRNKWLQNKGTAAPTTANVADTTDSTTDSDSDAKTTIASLLADSSLSDDVRALLSALNEQL